MARHNREGRGEDQHGQEYTVVYQPDWLHQVKVTRDLESGRQSTKTLLRNPEPPAREPGPKIRTSVSAPELGLDFQITLDDPRLSIRRVTVEATIPDGPEQGETVVISISRKRTRPRSASSAG
jgi:hypothetical protein